MRRTGTLALLALLAACTVTTTGAPCTSDANCPSDQGCGSDRTCSTAALSCPGHGPSGQCVPGTSCAAGQVFTCTSSGGVCSTASTAACPDPGQSCTTSGGVAACACPTSGTCTQLDATRCAAGGGAIERCLPAAAGSSCLAWQAQLDCAASGLVCSASACVCPANGGSTFAADAASGSTGSAPPFATGVASPPACRFSTLGEAIAVAEARGSGSTVRASGWSASLPGGVMVFAEPAPLALGPGVALATDDATPTTGHYAITVPTAVSAPLLTVGLGGSVVGFELRNVASGGDGVLASCPAAGDTAPVVLATLRVTGAGSGSPAPRLTSGVHVTGYCPVELTSVSVEGAATGLLVESAAATPAIASTATSTVLSGSTAAGASVIEGQLTFTGGTIGPGNAAGVLLGATGTGSPGFSATGTALTGNTGAAAIRVARGTLVADACSFQNNGTHVIAQPSSGATLSITVRNGTTMTGATDSALRLLALGSGSTLVLTGNEIRSNGATTSYNLASGPRRGGGIVFTAPFPGTVTFRGNVVSGNGWDQALVAASTGTLDLRGSATCTPPTPDANTLKCYDAANGGVGLYSNGAAVAADGNRWTNQPAVVNVDFAGSGISGENAACGLVSTCP